LSIILALIGLHSFSVGIGLMVMPDNFMSFFGFDPPFERFFSTQAGIFHIVLCVAYFLSAMNIDRYRHFILFTITAKFMATAFLIFYFVFVKNIWVVALSGILDGLMGTVVWKIYTLYKQKLVYISEKKSTNTVKFNKPVIIN